MKGRTAGATIGRGKMEAPSLLEAGESRARGRLLLGKKEDRVPSAFNMAISGENAEILSDSVYLFCYQKVLGRHTLNIHHQQISTHMRAHRINAKNLWML